MVTINIFTCEDRKRGHRRRNVASARMFFLTKEQEAKMAKGFIDMDQTSISSSLVLKDKFGNTVQPDTPPVWTLDRDDLVDMAISQDGMTAQFTPKAVGNTHITVKVDAEIGEGEKELLLEGDLEVTPADIATGEVTFGQAQD